MFVFFRILQGIGGGALQPLYSQLLLGYTAFLAGRGVPAGAAESISLKAIYGQAVKQATAMGFNDSFWLLSVMMACVLPLVLLLRRPDHQS